MKAHCAPLVSHSHRRVPKRQGSKLAFDAVKKLSRLTSFERAQDFALQFAYAGRFTI
jgi:hypothetical protein